MNYMNFIKKYLLLGVSIIFSTAASAQVVKIDSTSNWKKSFKAGLNINQASFSSNWKAGGVNSIGFNSFLNYKANYKKDKNSWENEFDFLYGMVNNQGQGYRKTLDRIFLQTKYGHQLSSKWSFTSSLSFLSQFAKGYSYAKDVNGVEQATLISDIFAPAFITSAWGVEYKPVDYFKINFSPFSPRVTIVTDNNGRFDAVSTTSPYGVTVGETTRFEWLAFQMAAEFNKDIAENVNLKWRYVMFANYETLEAKTIDHRLDLNLTAKVNRFVNVSLGGILLYDFDQDSGVQLSQAFSLGVLYTFQNFSDK
ncbi:MAG: DUF3078 domain-containing protein [Bacteroidetes bacterium CHB5]|nr:DUF3078 domain-containing protein [Bacteroidetes bacterium CHB5]